MFFKEFSSIFYKYFHLFDRRWTHIGVVLGSCLGTREYLIVFFPIFIIQMYPSEVIGGGEQAGLLICPFDKGKVEHQPTIGMALALVGDKVAQGVEHKLLLGGSVAPKLHGLQHMWVSANDVIHPMAKEEVCHFLLRLIGGCGILYPPVYHRYKFVKFAASGAKDIFLDL